MKVLCNVALTALLCFLSLVGVHAQEALMPLGRMASQPVAYYDFCVRYAPECDVPTLKPYNIVLTKEWMVYLQEFNKRVNMRIVPMSDLEHWGIPDRWDYPTDGYGDCEDYALEKQRLLIKAGWPRQALLITVVRRTGDIDGHAVLTVATDQGDFILDNLRDEVLLWSQTGYRFFKRQSQENPNKWVHIRDPNNVMFDPLEMFNW